MLGRLACPVLIASTIEPFVMPRHAQMMVLSFRLLASIGCGGSAPNELALGSSEKAPGALSITGNSFSSGMEASGSSVKEFDLREWSFGFIIVNNVPSQVATRQEIPS